MLTLISHYFVHVKNYFELYFKKVLDTYKTFVLGSLAMSRIPFYVKRVRKSLKLTQEAFAKKIGKTRGDIAKYENGFAIPPGDVLLRIQAAEKQPKAK